MTLARRRGVERRTRAAVINRTSATGFGLVLSMAWFPGAINAATAGRWALASAVLPVVVPRPQNSAGLWLLLGWIAASALALAWTPDQASGLRELWFLVLFALAWCIGQEATPDMAKGLWIGLGLGLVGNELVGFYQLGQGQAATGLFINKNYLAEPTLLVAAGLVEVGSWWLALALAPGLVVTWCRHVWLGMGLGLGWLGWNRLEVQIGLVLAAGAGLVLGNWNSLEQRVEMWATAIDNVKWFGWGLGSVWYEWPLWGHELVTGEHPEYIHSELVGWVSDLGVLAIAPLAFWVWHFARPNLVLVVGLPMLALDYPLHNPVTGLALGFAAGGVSRARFGLGRIDSYWGAGVFDGLGAGYTRRDSWRTTAGGTPGTLVREHTSRTK